MDFLQFIVFIFSGAFGVVCAIWGFGTMFLHSESIIIGIIGILFLLLNYLARPDANWSK